MAELKPDLIILDTESPDRDTLENLCIIRRDQPRPIVMFTHDDDSDKIRAEIDADDPYAAFQIPDDLMW